MTERKLASIRKISEIIPIDGADAIELAKVDGWQVVVKKGEFKPNDICIYCEVDSWVPETVAPFLFKGREFNGVKGERLRTIKLRGALSQGLILPFDGETAPQEIKEWAMVQLFPETACDHVKETKQFEGADVTEELGIQKWEKPLSVQLVGQAKGYFPEFLRKTDQERCQNLVNEIKESYVNRDEFEITIKLDGSSLTAYYKDGEVGVCSRNLELKLNDENAANTFIRTAIDTGLLEALKILGKNIAVQGELMGEGVQGNRENLKQHQIYVFDIYNIDTQEYLTPAERLVVFEELRSVGFIGEHCPILRSCVLQTGDVSELLDYAEGASINNPVREGLVFKRLDGKFSFKAISNKFLLKEKD